MASNTHLLELCRSHRRIFLALDRDGTLVAHQKRPEEALMPTLTRHVLNKLATTPNIDLALVSARSIKSLEKDLDNPIILAGNYGMEIRFPDGHELIAPSALKAVPELRKISAQLSLLVPMYQGAILDDHGYSLCLHWHLVAPTQFDALQQHVSDMAAKLNTLIMRKLPTSYEFLPNMDWDKGQALEAIASRLPTLNKDTLSIFIGDSEQDEPAFSWVNARDGVSLIVGLPESKTHAKRCLAQTADVIELLGQILQTRSDGRSKVEANVDPLGDGDGKFEVIFANLQREYVKTLENELDALEHIVMTAISKPDDISKLASARAQLHRQKGTIGSYGFTNISTLLADIEFLLHDFEKAQPDKINATNKWQQITGSVNDKFAAARKEVLSHKS